MQQLENKTESFDFDQELEEDLAMVNDAQERMSRGFDINEKIDEMQESKNVVDNVLSKLEDLVTLEGQLRFPSEYREVLNQNKGDLETYSKEMGRLLETYNNGVEAGQKFERKVVNGKVEKFNEYEESAKGIESTLVEIEREINNLKKLDDLQRLNEELQNEVNNLQRENNGLQNVADDLQRKNNELQNEVNDLQRENNELQNQNNRLRKQNKELENKINESHRQLEPTEEPTEESTETPTETPAETPAETPTEDPDEQREEEIETPVETE